MSSSYDIFDNLNSYLNAKDDVDFADEELEAEGGNLDDLAPDPDEIPPPIKQKRGLKAKAKTETEPPARKKSKRLQVTAAAAFDDDEDDEEILPSSSHSSASLSGSSSSHTSVNTQSAQVAPVNVSGDDLDEELKNMETQYNLLFNDPNMLRYKHLLVGLNRSYQSVMRRQKTARGRGSKTFMTDFAALKEDLFNACMNFNLIARPAIATASSSVQSTRRQRRQQQVELINLVDSPALILPGTVNLDSDEEEVTPNNKTADVSFDSENYEVSLKVKWEGKIERFAHRKFQKFGDLINMLAVRDGADPSHVVLDLDERIIEPEDTPDSIGYRISQFIGGRVVRGELAEIFNKKKAKATEVSKPKKPKDANEINLKVQSDRWKKPLEVSMRKDNKMMILIIKCAEELKCQPGEIKVSFDGDPVTMDSTPNELELEGGEVLDLRFVKG